MTLSWPFPHLEGLFVSEYGNSTTFIVWNNYNYLKGEFNKNNYNYLKGEFNKNNYNYLRRNFDLENNILKYKILLKNIQINHKIYSHHFILKININ